ncbi:MAG TPA: hypothetical protein VHW02_15495 [Rhizomicrobium sp.]|jgi:hypothetical protein|nr:hypothetical protein [Rhizomicrobium sp.]
MSAMVMFAVTLLVFAAVIYRRLRQAGFAIATASAVTLLTSAQAGIFCSVGGLWLALGVCAIVLAAAEFSTRDNVRSLIALGGSLSAIQLVNPAGGAVAALLLPVAMSRTGAMLGYGRLILLLFAPAVTAVLLASLYWFFHFNSAEIVSSFAQPAVSWQSAALVPVPRYFTLFFFLPAVAAFAPLIWREDRPTALKAVFAVMIAIVIAEFAVSFMATRSVALDIAFAAPTTAVAISCWPLRWRKAVPVLAVSGVSLAASWLLLFLG